VAAARGDLSDSLRHHRLGWLLMLYALLQVVRHGAWLGVPSLRATLTRPGRWLDLGMVPIGVMLLLNWFLTLSQML
jgi:hypothetical protein